MQDTIYRCPLPEHLIPFSSPKGIELFQKAFLDGGAKPFFKLIEQFHTQNDPGYCGLCSLAVVLNTLAIDPNRPWKGIFRWYTEDLLDCCVPLEQIRKQGITISQFQCLALCNNATCTVNYGSSTTLEQFRAAIEQVTYQFNGDDDPHYMVVSFDRRELKQVGTGHYSPIACYHKPTDMVLVLDVARFKYPPFFVTVADLYKAMLTKDEDTGKSRAYMVLARNNTSAQAVFAHINTADMSSFTQFKATLMKNVGKLAATKKNNCSIAHLNEVIEPFIETAMSTQFIAPMLIERKPLNLVESSCSAQSSCNASAACNNVPKKERAKFNWNALSKEHAELVKKLFTSVQSSSLYKIVSAKSHQSEENDPISEEEIILLCILFAAIPLQIVFDTHKAQLCGEMNCNTNNCDISNVFAESFWEEWQQIVETQVAELNEMNVEVRAVRSQLVALANSSSPASSCCK